MSVPLSIIFHHDQAHPFPQAECEEEYKKFSGSEHILFRLGLRLIRKQNTLQISDIDERVRGVEIDSRACTEETARFRAAQDKVGGVFQQSHAVYPV